MLYRSFSKGSPRVGDSLSASPRSEAVQGRSLRHLADWTPPRCAAPPSLVLIRCQDDDDQQEEAEMDPLDSMVVADLGESDL